MKKPLQILMDEHRHIERGCEVLIAMVNHVHEKQTCNTEDWHLMLDFIKGFADKCHHGKEENLLFATLKQRGMPVDGGPIGVMLSEHDIGRKMIGRMEGALKAIEKNDNAALKVLGDNAIDYVNLLTQHIQKEDNILYPMAETILNADDVTQLLAGYKHHEDQEMGKGTHEKFLTILNTLAKKYGEDKIPQVKGCGHGCGCGSQG